MCACHSIQLKRFPQFFFIFSTFTALVFCFNSGPLVYFCSSRLDPCTCVGGPYRLYRPLCSFLELDTADRASIYNSFVNGTSSSISIPGLHSHYVKRVLPEGGVSAAVV